MCSVLSFLDTESHGEFTLCLPWPILTCGGRGAGLLGGKLKCKKISLVPQVSDLTQSHLLSGPLGRRQSKQVIPQTASQTQRVPQTWQRPYSILSQFQLFKFPLCSHGKHMYRVMLPHCPFHWWLTHKGRIKEGGKGLSPCIFEDYFIVFNVATERNWSGTHYLFKEKVNCPLLFKKANVS